MSPARKSASTLAVPNDAISQRLHFWGEAFRQFGWPPILLFIALYGCVSVARWAEPWLTLTVKTHVEAINTMKTQQAQQTDIMERISENQKAIVTTLEVQGRILQEIHRAVQKEKKE